MILTFRWPALVLVTRLAMSAAQSQTDDRLPLLRKLVDDESPRVRVEALRALAKIPTAEAAEAALSVLQKPMDPTLDYALWLTINDLAEPWIASVKAGAWKPEEHPRELEFALRALRPEQTSQVLETVLSGKPLPRNGSGPWIEIIGSAGAPADLAKLWNQAVEGGFEPAATARALESLHEASRLRNQRPSGSPAALSSFLSHSDPAVRLAAIRLAGRWKEIGDALPTLLKVAGDSVVPLPERNAAFEALRQIGGEAVLQGLNRFSEPGRDPQVRRAAAINLASLSGQDGFVRAVETSETLTNDEEAIEYWRALLAIKGSALPLREALVDRRLSPLAAKAAMRAAREGGRDEIELVTAIAKAGGLTTDTQQFEAELMRELAAKAASSGDPRHGEQVYRRAELVCITCHAIGGAGGKVGPDLTSIGASAPMDYLVESLFLPNARIKEGYHSIIVETRDGEEVTGTLSRETTEELFLRNAAGQEVAIAKANIARRETGRLSMMPAGLLEPLTEKDRLDLIAFLSRLGKPGEFDASKGGVARLWRVANVVHTDVQNNQGDWYWQKPLNDKRWIPLLSLVNGDLPGPIIEEAVRTQAWTSKVAVVLATELVQTAPATVHLRSPTPGVEVWIGGKPLGQSGDLTCDLPAGTHRVVLKLDPRRLPDRVRLEVEGSTFALN